MRVLLVSMPDAIPLFYTYRSRLPHLGLASIAGNLKLAGCSVKTLDLVFFPKAALRLVKEALVTYRPHLVGLSAMSFQYESAFRIARLIKGLDSSIKIALGGYHATLMYKHIAASGDKQFFDFIIRGEGETAFRELIEKLLSNERDYETIAGLSFREGGLFVHNAPRSLARLEDIRLPQREASLFRMRYGVFKRAEAVETTRGCLMDCNFCSIKEMYGKNYREYPIERVIEDIRRAKHAGCVRIMFSDDNITMSPERFKRLCERIAEERLNTIYYGTQATVKGIAHSEELVKRMKDANVCLVFLGIENIDRQRLLELDKGDIREAALKAIAYLKKYDIGIMGGFMVGHPDDDRGSIREIFKFSKKVGIDFLMSQIVTPYPMTELQGRLLRLEMVENRTDYTAYNGYGCNVRTKHLSSKELKRLVVRENIKWFTQELFNRKNWFASSKRVKRHVHIFIFFMTLSLILEFLVGRFGRSNHSLKLKEKIGVRP